MQLNLKSYLKGHCFAKLYSCQIPWELPSDLLFPLFPGGYWTSDKKIPACTLSQALTYLLDITTPPSQQLLKKISQLVTAEGDKQRLEVLCHVSLGWSCAKSTVYWAILCPFTI